MTTRREFFFAVAYYQFLYCCGFKYLLMAVRPKIEAHCGPDEWERDDYQEAAFYEAGCPKA